jgi:hypothetical protein
VLVLDNCSGDGSAGAARAHPAVDDVIALEERRGKGENDTLLLQRARGRFCLLLNEDSELRAGASAALLDAMAEHPRAGAAGAALFRPDGTRQASAWRFPTPGTALAAALALHHWLTVQSGGEGTRAVDWAQSRGAHGPARGGGGDRLLRPDVLRLLRRGRLLPPPEGRGLEHPGRAGSRGGPPRAALHGRGSREADRRALPQPGPLHAQAPHPGGGRAVRWLTAWTYAVRALVALGLPGHEPRRYWRHVTATLRPAAGEGLREAASEHNRGGRRL